MLLFLQLARLGEQARIVAVQLGQLVLFDDQGLLGPCRDKGKIHSFGL